MEKYPVILNEDAKEIADVLREIVRQRETDATDFNGINKEAVRRVSENSFYDLYSYGNGSVFDDLQTIGTNFVGFQAVSISSGTSTVPTSGYDVAKHPGILRLDSSATVNSGYGVRSSTGAYILAGNERFDCIFYPVNLTNATFRVGFHDSTSSADATDGVYVEIPSTGQAIGKTADNSTRSSTSTIATLSAGNWYHIIIEINNAVSVATFSIFDDTGSLLGTSTLSANIPTARATGAAIVATESAGATQQLCVVDFIGVKLGRRLVRGAFT